MASGIMREYVLDVQNEYRRYNSVNAQCLWQTTI